MIKLLKKTLTKVLMCFFVITPVKSELSINAATAISTRLLFWGNSL